MWAIPSLAASSVVRQLPLLTAYFFKRNVSGGYTRQWQDGSPSVVAD